ncbi:hypothetical protein A0256_13335 [Mucilaginibacter sp. PAMC 26640]|nr:hypothetical protein A0256_13335 [Mucilaginibacter sp. PAMC 26640]
MQRHQIPKVKMIIMRKRFIEGDFCAHSLAKKLKLSTVTTWRYLKEFELIQAIYPERIEDMDFYMPKPPKSHRLTPLYVELMNVLPALITAYPAGSKAKPIWEKCRLGYPKGYTYEPFKDIYYSFAKSFNNTQSVSFLKFISISDLKVLGKWRIGNDHRRWQIATVLREALTCSTKARLVEKADCERKTVTGWLNIYQTKGLKGFDIAVRKPTKEVVMRIALRKDNLMKLLHETPKLYGMNRTSWTITALTEIYNRIHQQSLVSYMQISHSLKALGFSYKKSRDMLVSQDPKFREKISLIQRILQQLKPNEKFFSIDEYGPVGIRLKGGRTLKHSNAQPEVIPEKQKSKGFIIFTAALELSTNQVTHLYSQKKILLKRSN